MKYWIMIFLPVFALPQFSAGDDSLEHPLFEELNNQPVMQAIDVAINHMGRVVQKGLACVDGEIDPRKIACNEWRRESQTTSQILMWLDAIRNEPKPVHKLDFDEKRFEERLLELEHQVIALEGYDEAYFDTLDKLSIDNGRSSPGAYGKTDSAGQSWRHITPLIDDLGPIFKPRFSSTEGEFSAGTASIINYQGAFMILTAHHLFSEAGGLSREYRWWEIEDLIDEVLLLELIEGAPSYGSDRPIVITGARSPNEYSGSGDIAVFALDEAPRSWLSLSQQNPEVGSSVWLYAKLSGKSNKELLHKATVIESNDAWLQFRYDNPSLTLSGSSGAPILNSSGELVGINLTGYTHRGYLQGGANPVSAIRDRLEKAKLTE